jgi:hypothetical protein
MVEMVDQCYDPHVKLSVERDGTRTHWSVETTGAVDRAFAGMIALLGLLVAHAAGFDAPFLHWFSSIA